MELVEGDAGVGQMLRHALDEGWGHIDADAGDPLRRALVFAQELAEPADGLGIAAFRDEHHFVRFGIGGKGQIVVAARQEVSSMASMVSLDRSALASARST